MSNLGFKKIKNAFEELAFFVLLVGPVAASIVYTFSVRDLHENIAAANKIGPYIFTFFLFGLTAVVVPSTKNFTKTALQKTVLFLVVLAAAIGTTTVTFCLTVSAFDLGISVANAKNPVYVTVIAVVSGFAFWAFRLIARCLYGIIEIASGIGIAFFNATKGQASMDLQVYAAILTGGVYLVVRGLDNVHQGWERKEDGSRKDKVISWVFNRLNVYVERKKAAEAAELEKAEKKAKEDDATRKAHIQKLVEEANQRINDQMSKNDHESLAIRTRHHASNYERLKDEARSDLDALLSNKAGNLASSLINPQPRKNQS